MWLLAILLLCGGCGEQETIRRYQVAKPEPTRRLFGAVVPRGEQYWFFKLTGSREALDSQAEPFLSLIRSLRFPDDPKAPPAWTLPAGWEQTEGSGFRYATIAVKSGRETLQVSVTKLPRSGGDEAEYILSNVNLWRQQLNLTPLAAPQLATAATRLPLSGGKDVTATVVDFVGFAARGGGHSGMTPVASPSPPTASEAPLRYAIPDGWSAGQLVISRGGVEVRRQAAFEVRQEARRVEITVTRLPASGNSLLSNVNRWRRQIELDAISAEQLAKDSSEITVGELPAHYVQLTGPKEAILGVVVVHEQTVWFVKLQGDPELAAREKQRFEDFAKSLRFET